MRKIIQIAFKAEGNVSQDYDRDSGYGAVYGSTDSTMYVLCDDGSIWYEGYDKEAKENKWYRTVPAIPDLLK